MSHVSGYRKNNTYPQAGRFWPAVLVLPETAFPSIAELYCLFVVVFLSFATKEMLLRLREVVCFCEDEITECWEGRRFDSVIGVSLSWAGRGDGDPLHSA